MRQFVFILMVATFFLPDLSMAATPIQFYDSGRSLRFGMSGRNIVSLQLYLADQGIYPKNLVTGYFGRITELAVKVFQLKHGIEAIGIVGPKTRAKIGGLIKDAGSSPRVTVATSTVSGVTSGIDHLPPPLVVATSSEVGDMVITIVNDLQLSDYKLGQKPDYNLRQLAKDIQNLINEKREAERLGFVYWDEELASVSLEHSQDQARDNAEITNPESPCHYPIIRHEGFTQAGYSLKDRYASRNIHYRYGGENIAMIPESKDLLYLRKTTDPLIECEEVEKFLPGNGSKEERSAFFQRVLENSFEAAKMIPPVNWIQRSWRSGRELAEITVNGWMNSPGHRENILRPEFTLGGIGIASVNDYIIITHNFVGR